MAKLVNIEGVEEVIANIKKMEHKTAKGIEKGLRRAGFYLQRESKKIVPVQTGNLKASGFTRKLGSGTNTDVVVGYTAKYAVYVHEDLEAAHGEAFNIKHAEQIKSSGGKKKRKTRKGDVIDNPWFRRGPNQQAKFLERPAREKRPQILLIIYGDTKGTMGT